MKSLIIAAVFISLVTTWPSYTAEDEKKLLWENTRKLVDVFYRSQDKWDIFHKGSRYFARSNALHRLEKNPALKQQDALAYAPTLSQMQDEYQQCRQKLGSDRAKCLSTFSVTSVAKQVLQRDMLTDKGLWRYLAQGVITDDPDPLLTAQRKEDIERGSQLFKITRSMVYDVLSDQSQTKDCHCLFDLSLQKSVNNYVSVAQPLMMQLQQCNYPLNYEKYIAPSAPTQAAIDDTKYKCLRDRKKDSRECQLQAYADLVAKEFLRTINFPMLFAEKQPDATIRQVRYEHAHHNCNRAFFKKAE